MAIEIRQFTAVIPAGTLQTAPVTIPMVFPQRTVATLEIIVPPGFSGLVGFAINAGGSQVIPYDVGQWIVTADEKIVWPLDGFPTTGSWSLTGWNSGTNDHAVYVRFLCDPVTAAATPTLPAMLDDDAITPVDTTLDDS